MIQIFFLHKKSKLQIRKNIIVILNAHSYAHDYLSDFYLLTPTLMLSVNSPPGISVVLSAQMILPVSGSTSMA